MRLDPISTQLNSRFLINFNNMYTFTFTFKEELATILTKNIICFGNR